MAVIIKDLMNGNKNLPEGREEEMVGHNALAAGFQGRDSGQISIQTVTLQKLC